MMDVGKIPDSVARERYDSRIGADKGCSAPGMSGIVPHANDEDKHDRQ